jgi:hypothetical protein
MKNPPARRVFCLYFLFLVWRSISGQHGQALPSSACCKMLHFIAGFQQSLSNYGYIRPLRKPAVQHDTATAPVGGE